jgi:hypothetical protein
MRTLIEDFKTRAEKEGLIERPNGMELLLEADVLEWAEGC